MVSRIEIVIMGDPRTGKSIIRKSIFKHLSKFGIEVVEESDDNTSQVEQEMFQSSDEMLTRLAQNKQLVVTIREIH